MPRDGGRGPSALLEIKGAQSDGDSQGKVAELVVQTRIVVGLLGAPGEPGLMILHTLQRKLLCLRLLSSIQRSRGAQGCVREHKIRKCPQHSCLYGLLWVLLASASAGKGISSGNCAGLLPPPSAQYSSLCIIYYCEVSRQLSHHIILEEIQTESVQVPCSEEASERYQLPLFPSLCAWRGKAMVQLSPCFPPSLLSSSFPISEGLWSQQKP